jgi:hypothetical protein
LLIGILGYVKTREKTQKIKLMDLRSNGAFGKGFASTAEEDFS